MKLRLHTKILVVSTANSLLMKVKLWFLEDIFKNIRLYYTCFFVGGISGCGDGVRKLGNTYNQYDKDDGTVDVADIEKLKFSLLGGFERSCGCGS